MRLTAKDERDERKEAIFTGMESIKRKTIVSSVEEITAKLRSS